MSRSWLYHIPLVAWLTSHAAGLQVRITNGCKEELWPASHGFMSNIPIGLLPGEAVDSEITPPWSGRVWMKSGCEKDGSNCKIGDCNHWVDCVESSASNVTLVEMTVTPLVVDYDISIGRQHASSSILC